MTKFDWEAIPEKRFFRIGEAARLVGVKAHVLRYWETEFPEVRPRKTRSNQRIYRLKDIQTLRLIRELLHGRRFTHEGARQHLRQHGRKLSSSQIPTARPVAAPAQAPSSAEQGADLQEQLKARIDRLEGDLRESRRTNDLLRHEAEDRRRAVEKLAGNQEKRLQSSLGEVRRRVELLLATSAIPPAGPPN